MCNIHLRECDMGCRRKHVEWFLWSEEHVYPPVAQRSKVYHCSGVSVMKLTAKKCSSEARHKRGISSRETVILPHPQSPFTIMAVLPIISWMQARRPSIRNMRVHSQISLSVIQSKGLPKSRPIFQNNHVSSVFPYLTWFGLLRMTRRIEYEVQAS